MSPDAAPSHPTLLRRLARQPASRHSLRRALRWHDDGTAVYPREVVKTALGLNAAAVIFAHNHPSGVAEPSQADECLTRKLEAALDLVSVRVLDHIIVAERSVSLAARGLL